MANFVCDYFNIRNVYTPHVSPAIEAAASHPRSLLLYSSLDTNSVFSLGIIYASIEYYLFIGNIFWR